MNLYLAVGHGVQPNGRLDPGAADGPTQEHHEAHRVCRVASAALHRSGVVHVTESDMAEDADPDYRGSIKAINAGAFDLAVEVHFDTAAAPRGGFGIYRTHPARRLADTIGDRWELARLPRLPSYADRRGLYFLRAADCTALIWECDRVSNHTDDEISRMGEALAGGICDWLEQPYVPPSVKEDDDMQRFVIDAKGTDDLGRDSVWEFDEQGNAHNWNAARTLKSRHELDPGTKVPVVAVIADPSGDGVVLIGGDERQDDRGHWVRSTWRITVGM